MNLILQDLEENEWNELHIKLPKESLVIPKKDDIQKCIGCFSCWVKTPGKCAIKDSYQDMGKLLGQAEHLFIISRCTFGTYSSYIKNVMERSISYILPFFEIRQKEMHHKARYQNRLKVHVIFYGDDITEDERKTAKQLVIANVLNMNGHLESISFCNNAKDINII